MIDSFTKTQRTGWFSRMKSAIIGVLFGILMIPGSVLVLGWNEYRTIHRTQGLKQGAKLVETIQDPNSVDSQLDRKLVHVTGHADTEDQLRDEDFQIEAQAIKLKRIVEMYQWIEDSDTKEKKKLGGGTERVTVYSYQTDWKSDREDSENFEQTEGHRNPAEKYSEQTTIAELAKIGAYELNDTLKGMIDSYEPVPLTEDMVSRLDQELQDHVLLDGEFIYWSAAGKPALDHPEVGDQRIKFEVVKPATVSLIAQQTGKTFDSFEVPNGETIQKLYVGQFSAVEMFEKFQQENVMMAWMLRAAGVAFCCLGFFLVMSPLAVFADIVPFFGSLTRGLTGIIAGLLGVCVSSMTIAFAWIAVRPLIGIPMLIVGIGCIVLLYRVIANRKKSDVTPPAADEEIPYVPMA